MNLFCLFYFIAFFTQGESSISLSDCILPQIVFYLPTGPKLLAKNPRNMQIINLVWP